MTNEKGMANRMNHNSKVARVPPTRSQSAACDYALAFLTATIAAWAPHMVILWAPRATLTEVLKLICSCVPRFDRAPDFLRQISQVKELRGVWADKRETQKSHMSGLGA